MMAISENSTQVAWGFDLKSPYSFVAFQIIQRYQEFGVDFRYIPVSIVDLFKISKNTPPHEACENKFQYLQQDLINVGRWCQVPLKLSSRLISMDTKFALRCLLVIQDHYNEFFIACLKSIWEGIFYQKKDIEQLSVVRELLPLETSLIDNVVLLAQSSQYTNQLIKNTQFMCDKGAYGLPYFVVGTSQGERTFYGMDRLPNLCEFISKSYSGPSPHSLLVNPRLSFSGTVTFAFDILSPYGYFARKVLQRYESIWSIDIDYVPVHMPTIFKESGNHGPIYGCKNKKTYTLQDLEYLPQFYNVEFKIPSKFPCNTIPGQTLLLLIKDQHPQFFMKAMDLLWDAFLQDDQNIESFEVLQNCLQELDIPVKKLIEEAKTPQQQQRILDLTKKAVQAGAHGLPFITVKHNNNNQPQHFFGSDRLECLAFALNQPYLGPNPDSI